MSQSGPPVAQSWAETQSRTPNGNHRLAIAAEIYTPADELIVRYFLRNEPNAQEELTKWIVAYRKR